MRLKTSEIAAISGGQLHGAGDVSVTGAALDSRKACCGDLFLCLPGERVDGHDFAASACQNDCAAILAAKPLPQIAAPVIVVPDVGAALARIARHLRASTRAKVVCVTGTAGKTTLKEILLAILGRKGRVSATAGNQNNQLGLPLTILNAEGDDDFWILEAGINHPGDMDFLGEIARPDLAVILNVGAGHTEGLGAKGVAWHKARLLCHLAPGGLGLVSADYADLVAACAQTGALHAFFSIHGNAQFMALKPDQFALDGRSFTPDRPFACDFERESALAAAAAAVILGIEPAVVAAGLGAARRPAQRFNTMHCNGNVRIYDDTYNANPLSMERMLNAAAAQARKLNLPFIAVLGEMGELGAESAHWHGVLGAQLARLAPTAIFWTGGNVEALRQGLGQKAHLLTVTDAPASLPAAWRERGLPETNFLAIFKGSRANRLERHLREFCQTLKLEPENAV